MEKEKLFFNREISWLEFNYRVLEEALDKNTPLLDRMKFLSIFSSNLDEFFMVRISGVISQVKSGYTEVDSAGYTPLDVLNHLETRIKELVNKQYNSLTNEVLKELEEHDFKFFKADDINEKQKKRLGELFSDKYYMIITPMAIDQARPFPFLNNKHLNLLLELSGKKNKDSLFAIIPIPKSDRFIKIPDSEFENHYIYMEEFIKLFADQFFKGYEILKTCTFRVTRDADFSVDEEENNDLLSAIEDGLRQRDRGMPIRLEVESGTDQGLLDFLHSKINFWKGFDFKIDGPIDLTSFMQIAFSKGYDNLRNKVLSPIKPIQFSDDKKSMFDVISEGDVLLHHPYESFDPVINLVKEASEDPRVLAIKQTLYRTSGDSPIIHSLKRAAKNGKQVTVLVELKARFDEAQNITWAKQLEKEGCHVIYGLVGLKTHAKLLLIVRDEDDGIKRYIHLSTGNYNDKTAKVYTDMGLFTARKSFGRDVSAIFNLLTGYSDPPRWKKLVTAPLDLRSFILTKIENEIKNVKSGKKGSIIAKMNSLVDEKAILALYEASKMGVKIKLVVRGMCLLKPGVKGLSENITVISIVDNFLEHSRIFYFYNDGAEDVYLASADWMERNFDRRVETLFPILSDSIKKEIIDSFDITFKDNVKARVLQRDGTYIVKNRNNDKKYISQIEFYNYLTLQNENKIKFQGIKFIPRVNPNLS